MASIFEIRADYDSETIVMYQAYRKEIALAALNANRFVPPFSVQRMTWIKPSYLWLMERSNWGKKSDQEYILAVRITRKGFEEALRLAVLTSFKKQVYRNEQEWRQLFEKAIVVVQWDPERSLRGKTLDYASIQIGLSRHIIQKYVEEWTVQIQDYTPLTRKLEAWKREGKWDQIQKQIPPEKVYPLPSEIATRLGIV